jgi:HEAT repeat protein
MLRRCLALIASLSFCLGLSAGESTGPSDQLLAAARRADEIYQRHLVATMAELRSAQPPRRLAAIRELMRLQDPQAIPSLSPFLEAATRSPEELRAACTAVANLQASTLAPAVKSLLGHTDAEVRLAAMNALNLLAKAGPLEWLERAKKDADDAQRLGSYTHLAVAEHREAGEAMAQALAKDPRKLVRRTCAIGLGKLGDRSHGPALAEALCDPDAGVRRYAAEALARLDYKPAIPHLLMAMEGNIASAHVAKAVRLLAGHDFGFDPRADLASRTAAVDRGFAWWNQHALANGGK